MPPAEDAIEEAEVVTIDDGEDDIGTASTKRRKVEASKRTGDVGRRGQGGNANSNKPGSVAGDSDTEEEDEQNRQYPLEHEALLREQHLASPELGPLLLVREIPSMSCLCFLNLRTLIRVVEEKH